MIPLVIVRPEPGAGATLRAARALGLEAQAHPLFTVRPVPWEPVARNDIDALILGSANAIRHAGSALETYRKTPTYCVGETTAKAAQEAGLVVVRTGSGGLQNVLKTLDPEHKRLLRLAGVTRLDLDLPAGVSMVTRDVYCSAPLPLSVELANTLKHPCVIALHSGEAATHFAAICTAAKIERSHLTLAVIGPRVAELVSPSDTRSWGKVAIAQTPSDSALLALAYDLCQEVERSARPHGERPDARR